MKTAIPTRQDLLITQEHPPTDADRARERINRAALQSSRLVKRGVLNGSDKAEVWIDPEDMMRGYLFFPFSGQIYKQVAAVDIPALGGQGYREAGE